LRGWDGRNMAIIFLSYPSENRSVADCLRAQLEAYGHEVWYDTNILVAGDDWRRELSEALPLCDAV